jgi:hypothetical protein
VHEVQVAISCGTLIPCMDDPLVQPLLIGSDSRIDCQCQGPPPRGDRVLSPSSHAGTVDRTVWSKTRALRLPTQSGQVAYLFF